MFSKIVYSNRKGLFKALLIVSYGVYAISIRYTIYLPSVGTVFKEILSVSILNQLVIHTTPRFNIPKHSSQLFIAAILHTSFIIRCSLVITYSLPVLENFENRFQRCTFFCFIYFATKALAHRKKYIKVYLNLELFEY